MVTLPWWVGICLSVGLALFRYRFPALHPRIASAGMGACLGFVTGQLLQADTPLFASIILNGALLGAVIDHAISTRGRPIGAASSATLTLQFPAVAPPTEVANQNVHSWYATSIMVNFEGAEGQRQRHVFNNWVVAVWFRDDLFDYQIETNTLAGEQAIANIIWRSERGFFFSVEAPAQPSTVQFRAISR